MSLTGFTALFIVVSVVIWIVYDIYAIVKGGVKATISAVITEFSWYSPSLPLAVGCLIGHWFL